MAQPQFNPVGILEGNLVGRGVGALVGNSPVGMFLPSFYNSNYSNPVQGFQNSQMSQILRGNTNALGNFALNRGAAIAGGAVAGPLGAFVAPQFVNLLRGRGLFGTGDGRGSLFGEGGLFSSGANGPTGYYATPQTDIGPPTLEQQQQQQQEQQRLANSQRMASETRAAIAATMPAFNNGGSSWGFATSNNPYAAMYGGDGSSPTGLHNASLADDAMSGYHTVGIRTA